MNECISILLPDLRGGGAERVAVNLANAFARKGHRVDLVLLHNSGELAGAVDSAVRVVELRARRLRHAIGLVSRYLASERPRAMLACMWPLTVIAVWSRMLARSNARLVVAEHTTWSGSPLVQRKFNRWLVKNSMRFFFPRADNVVTVSHASANDLVRFACLDSRLVSSIYNPVVADDRQPFGPLPTHPEEWCKGYHRRILAVGNLKSEKGYADLLEAFAILSKRVNAKLLILGEGPLRQELEQKGIDLGLSERVFMPGYVDNPAPFYRHAHLHVLSSNNEGLGNVLIEALAAGTPVVSTDCPSGPREILCAGRYGRLVPVGDANALADAMADSLASSHDHASLQARAQDFSIDKAADGYLQLLIPLAAQPKP